MKIVAIKTVVLVLALISLAAGAQPPAGKAMPGTIYGAKTDKSNFVEAIKIPEMLKEKDTISVKVKAKVLDACAAKGCWMTLKINDTTEAMVKMKDYGFFVPQDIIGKTVVVEGKSYIKTTSVSELKHYAEDAKKPQAEIDAITRPEKQVRFMAR